MAATSVGLSLALDALFGELPERVHPVAWFGHAAGRFDRTWSSPDAVGLCLATALPLGAAAVLGGVTAVAVAVDPIAGAAVAGVALFAATSRRMLLSTARQVIDRSETDPGAARGDVDALVGRDAASLSEAELRSAALESAAENLADGLVAPLVAFALGAQLSLSLAVGAATWVKAVNTLDSMLGYRSKPVGRASARLDDLVMWLPARLAAVLIALAGRSPGSLRRARDWRDAPASPNSGWPMATLAAVLDVRLRKPGHYVLNPDGPLPDAETARAGVRLVGVAGAAAFLLSGVLAWV